jgi:hypothetical protein
MSAIWTPSYKLSSGYEPNAKQAFSGIILGHQMDIDEDGYQMSNAPEGTAFFGFYAPKDGNPGTYNYNCNLPDPGHANPAYRGQLISIENTEIRTAYNFNLTVNTDDGKYRISAPTAPHGLLNKIVLANAQCVVFRSRMVKRGSNRTWVWMIWVTTATTPEGT